MFNNAATAPTVPGSSPGSAPGYASASSSIEKLWVLYDPACGFCVSCRRWLERQPAWVPLEFLPAGSDAAAAAFPGLAGTGEELTVVASDGSVYRADAAWLVCLWALQEYRGLAERLSSPALLPYARHAFELVARNRKEISRALGLLPEDELRAHLGRVAPTCAKPPLPAFELPVERGGAGAKVVLGVVAALLVFILVTTFREPISGWLLERGIVRNARALRVLAVDPDAALRSAAETGRPDRIRRLVAAGVDPNRRDPSGRSPLYAAVVADRRASVEALLALGADPLGPDPQGRPIPISAAESGRTDLLPLFHPPQSIWQKRDDAGATPLLRSVESHNLPAVRAMLAAGADPNDGGVETPLVRACDFGWVDVVEVLLAGKANPNAPDSAGDPPLVRLARLQPGFFEKVADRLIAAGADVNLPGARGVTPLLAATEQPDPRTARSLIRRGADPNRRDDSGRSALSYAAEKGALFTADALLAAGADPNSRDAKDNTPLMHAAASSEADSSMTSRLVEAGANLRLVNAEGLTALDLARRTADARRVAWILEAQRRAESSGVPTARTNRR